MEVKSICMCMSWLDSARLICNWFLLMNWPGFAFTHLIRPPIAMHAYQTSYAADDGSHPWSLNESCLQASTILSLDLCPEFMRDGVGQASFLFHISQGFLPILEGRSVEKSKSRWGRFHFTFKNRWEMWNGFNLRVITMRGRGISFHGPINSGEAGGHRSKPEVLLALVWGG